MKSSSRASSKDATSSQFHHFIPRFILRNFAHPFDPSNGSKDSTKWRKKYKKGYYPGDPMLYTINLTGTTAKVLEAPVSHSFGLTDMYRDLAAATNQHSLEQQLSRLESRAATVIVKIRKDHEAGKDGIWLSRAEKNTLRKFLFIMKYRGSGFHKRFYHQTDAAYYENDKVSILKYMRERGYEKPIDIWFDNLKSILEIDMDLKGDWMAKLKESMYPGDAEWAISNIQGMYLGLCTPSCKGDEFLITENVYTIHEGPNSLQMDVITGEETPTAYTEYHVFGAISPTLIMVLRSLLLPDPEEDSDDRTRKMRETLYQLSASQHNDPSQANSSLADLPISKAQNTYTRVVNGSRVLADGADGSRSSHDKFCFRFFPISTLHLNKINGIMLAESHSITTIAFKSQLAARKTLEYYLSMPCELENAYRSKTVGDGPDDKRLICLKKLEQAARQLGSETTAAYHIERSKLDEKFDILRRVVQDSVVKEPEKCMNPYANLGGSALLMPKDTDQASKMLNMRIKVDVWSKGVDENIREQIRDHVRDLFYELPARRVWLYLKYIRNMLLRGGEAGETAESQTCMEAWMEGPEDTVANAHQLFRAKDLCRLMFFATMNHIHLTQTPDFDIGAEISLDENGARRLAQIKTLAFGPAGSICDCGIEAIEQKARFYRQMLQVRQIPREYQVPFWPKNKNIEMATRIFTRDDYSKLVLSDGTLSRVEVPEGLEHVLFDVVYPCKLRNQSS